MAYGMYHRLGGCISAICRKKLAVANVILNRVRSGHYPGTVSGVVYQRSQFSGVSDGAGNPSDRFAARLANGPRNTECMQAA